MLHQFHCTISKLDCQAFTKVRLGVIAVELTNPCNRKHRQVYALQDTRSTSTITHKSLAKDLGLQGDLQKISAGGINALRNVIAHNTNVRIKGIEKQELYELHGVLCLDSISTTASSLSHDIDHMRYPHPSDIACFQVACERCNLHIGSDHFHRFEHLNFSKFSCSSLFRVET